MKKKRLVSVIIPIYNIANYLQQCIDSLLNQSYSELEIILIDDGSTDRSPQICDENEKKDSRIKVIHKQNAGAASARNIGLDVAKGNYICFIDSDDYVKENYVEKLLYSLEMNNADVSVCSYQYLYKDAIEHEYMDPLGVVSEKEFIRRFLTDWKCGLLWNKMFKATLMRNVRFEEGHKIDDEFFTYKVIMNADKVVVINDELHMYRMRASSVMQSTEINYERMLQDRFEYLTQRYLDVIKKYPDLKKEYLENLVDNFIRLLSDSRCNKECYDHMKQQIDGCRDWIKGTHINFFLKRAFKKALKAKYEPMEWTNIKDSDKVYFE